eukprot:m.225263 g.225263  ORF g.225263 m.225263 type:complete len:411 (+) comp15955_c1_seq5:470-1702(+)
MPVPFEEEVPLLKSPGNNPAYSAAKTPRSRSPVETPTFCGEVPDEDVEETETEETQNLTATPPVDWITPIKGYESMSYHATIVPSPPFSREPPQPTSNAQSPQTTPITHEQARTALLEEVAQHCCWGKGPAQNLGFGQILPSHAFHYTLQTFTEARFGSWVYQPYNGEPIDGLDQGPAPPAWEIPVTPPENFKNDQKITRIPHTSSVKKCFHCIGYEQVRCHGCKGRGKLKCKQCKGTGRMKDKDNLFATCNACYGSGRRRCGRCEGHGEIGCPVCAASGQLHLSLQLSVRWTVHTGEHVVEKTSLPKGLVTEGQGSRIHFEESLLVPPIHDFPEESVSVGSHGLVQRHQQQWTSERILRQRHSVRCIPVSEVNYYYKSEQYTYWVYGLDHKAYVPTYPASLMWGLCTIS